MTTASQKTSKTEKAQGMVEFALILPLLLVLMFGLIEAGRLLLAYSAVYTASREAARYGSAAGDLGSPGRYEDCNGIKNAARRVGGVAGIQEEDISINYTLQSGATATCDSIVTEKVTAGDRIDVTVEMDYEPLLPLVDLPSFPISSTSRRTILKDIEVNGLNALPESGTVPKVQFHGNGATVSEAISTPETADGTASVTLKLNTPPEIDVTVMLSASGSATNGEDYYLTTWTTLIPAGSTAFALDIPIYNDRLDEPNETILLSITAVSNAVKDSEGNLTYILIIEDDDLPPFVYFERESTSWDEANCNSSTAIKALLSWPSANAITVPVDLAGSSAIEGIDFTLSSSTLEFPAGSVEASFFLNVLNDQVPCGGGDGMDEYDEQVVLTLQPAANVILNPSKGPLRHTLTIIDDDPPPQVFFTWEEQTVAVNSGRASVEVQLSRPSGKEIRVPYEITGTTGFAATPSQVFFAPGSTSFMIQVHFFDDLDLELTENIQLKLGLPAEGKATLGTPNLHTINITQEALPPSVGFTLAEQTVSEAAGNLTVEVRLDRASNQNITVPFSVGGSADVFDYSMPGSTVLIPAGASYARIPISIKDDGVDEVDETITLTLSKPEDALLGAATTHTITIVDDDTTEVSFNPVSGVQREDGQPLTLQIVLSTPSSRAIEVPLILGGTATPGSDYRPPVNPVIIPAGETKADILLELIDDKLIENDETATLTMGTPKNAKKGTQDVYILTIHDDDILACPDAGAPVYPDDYSVYFDLYNYGVKAIDLEISKITLSWMSGQDLRQVELDELTLWSGSDKDNYFEISFPNAKMGSYPTIAPGTSMSLIFSFKKTFTGYWTAVVNFRNGCSVTVGNN